MLVVKLIAYSYWNEGKLDDVSQIVRRALELQHFLEFYNEEIPEVLSVLNPKPLALESNAYDILYGELEDHLGVRAYPKYYEYTLRLSSKGMQRSRVDKLDLRRYIFYDEFDGEGVTLKDLGKTIPGVGGFGIYRSFKPNELWLTGKLKKDHIRAFFKPLFYEHSEEWEAMVVSPYPYILQDGVQVAIEWEEEVADEAMMLLLEMLHNHQTEDDEILESLLDTMMQTSVAEDAYDDFQSSPWSVLDAQVYRHMYADPSIVKSMAQNLVEFYTRAEEVPHHEKAPEAFAKYVSRLMILFKAADKIVYYLIDAFAPLIGEWRLAAFASEMCKKPACEVKEFTSLAEGVQSLTERIDVGEIDLNMSKTLEGVTLLLHPEDRIPDMTLIRAQRV